MVFQSLADDLPDTSLSDGIGQFVYELSEQTVPQRVLDKARDCILNGFGIGLGALNEPHVKVAQEAVRYLDEGGTGRASVLGTGMRTSLNGALMANCTLLHGRIQEDTCGGAHFGVVVLPLLIGLAETREIGLERFLISLIAGYEAGGVVERNLARHTTPLGFRITAVYGPIAAAAAASKFLELTPAQCSAAISNAAAFTGGNMQGYQERTDEQRYQIAMPAIQGAFAAALARSGSISGTRSIEGPVGLSQTIARIQCDATSMLDELGSKWALDDVTFKPFSVCAFNQTPVMAALNLRERLDVDQISSIELRMNSVECSLPGMKSKGPFFSIIGTQLSSAFCVAVALQYGAITSKLLSSFNDRVIARLVDQVTIIADPAMPNLGCTLRVTMRDEKIVEETLQNKPSDFSFGRERLSNLVRDVGREHQVPDQAYATVEEFAENPGHISVSGLVDAFSLRQASKAEFD